METTTINGVSCSIRTTKTQNGTVVAGYAYVPILDESDVCVSIQALIDDGLVSSKQCKSWFESGCAVDTQARVRNGVSAKWADKLIGQYWGRVTHDGSYETIVGRCKELFQADQESGTSEALHIAPWGNVNPDE